MASKLKKETEILSKLDKTICMKYCPLYDACVESLGMCNALEILLELAKKDEKLLEKILEEASKL